MKDVDVVRTTPCSEFGQCTGPVGEFGPDLPEHADALPRGNVLPLCVRPVARSGPGCYARVNVSRFNVSRFNVSRFTVSRFTVSRFNVSRFTVSRFTVSRFTVSRFTVSRFTVSRFTVCGFTVCGGSSAGVVGVQE
ncbi:hypothetical protein GCM10010530_55200 [Kribbella aluminosa]